MGKLTVRALRAVLAVVLTGTVFVQALMVWALVSGSDQEDGSLPPASAHIISTCTNTVPASTTASTARSARTVSFPMTRPSIELRLESIESR